MTKHIPNIDDLFNKARFEQALLSHDEARRLIEDRDYSKAAFFRIKGVKLMYIFSSALLISTLAYFFSLSPESINNSTPSPTENKSQPIVIQTKAVPNASQSLLDTKSITTNQHNKVNSNMGVKVTGLNGTLAMVESEQPEENQPMQILELVGEVATIKGVHIINLTYEELEQLGIKYYPNYQFFFSYTENNEPTQSFEINEHGVSFLGMDNKQVKGLSPRLITDANGNMKFSRLNLDGNKTVLQAKSTYMNNNNVSTTSYSSKTNGGSFVNMGLISSNDTNKSLADLEEQIKLYINNIKDKSPQASKSIDKVNIDSILHIALTDPNSIPIAPANKLMKCDSAKVFRRFCVNPDTSLCNGNVKMAVVITKKFDDKESDTLGYKPCSKFLEMNLSDIENPISDLNMNIAKLNQNPQDFIRINKLIPVALRTPDKKIDYLIWFDPNEDLLKALPKPIAEEIAPEVAALTKTNDFCETTVIAGKETYFDLWRSCNGSIEKLSVYPNPAKSFFEISFNLKEARNIRISLFDLNGNKINLLKNYFMYQPGEIKERLSLQNVPPGIYLIAVESDKSEQVVQRIVVE